MPTSLSLTEATGQGSMGGGDDRHAANIGGRSARGTPSSPYRRWPRDEVRREEEQRRTTPPDDQRAANIGGRIDCGVSLPEEGNATSRRHSPREYLGRGTPARPSPTRATRRGSGGRRSRGASSPRTTATANIWGRTADASFPYEDPVTRFGGRKSRGASSPWTTATLKIWGRVAGASLPDKGHATRVGESRTRGASSPRMTATP